MNLSILALFCADGCWSSVKDFISLFKLGPDVKIFMSYYWVLLGDWAEICDQSLEIIGLSHLSDYKIADISCRMG